MKVTAFDPEYPYRRGVGTTGVGTPATGDLSGTYPGPTVSGIQGVSVASNAPTTIGDVLTVIQVTPPVATWATPSNSGGGGGAAYSLGGSLSGAVSVDLDNGTWQYGTLAGNITITLAAVTTGLDLGLTLELTQDGSGGHTVTWPGSVSWLGGSEPTHDTTASTTTLWTLLTRDGGTTWVAGQLGGGGGSSSVTAADIVALGFVGPLLIRDGATAPITIGTDVLVSDSEPDLMYADLG